MQQLTLATAEFERYPKTTLASGDCGRDGGDAVVGGGAGSAPIVAQRPAHCGFERAKDESRQLIRGKVPIGGVSPLRTDRLWVETSRENTKHAVDMCQVRPVSPFAPENIGILQCTLHDHPTRASSANTSSGANCVR